MTENQLPISLQKDITSYMFLAYPLCVLYSNKKYINWFMERFVNIKMNKDFDLMYTGWAYEIYGEIEQVLDISRIYHSMIYDNQDIINDIIRQIDLGRYAYIQMDEFYLSPQSAYKKMHFRHDSLIYGYNTEKQCVYSISIKQSMGNFRKVIYTFDELRRAFYAQEKSNSNFTPHYNEETVSVIWLKPKNYSSQYIFSKADFDKRLSDYFYGTDSFNDCFLTSIRQYKGDEFTYGINIYKNFIEHFAELEIFDISAYRAIHFLYEHKKNIRKRFEFLEAIDKDIIHYRQQYDELVQGYEFIRMLCLKNAIFHNDKIFEGAKKKIVVYLKAMLEKEQSILQEYLNCI